MEPMDTPNRLRELRGETAGDVGREEGRDVDTDSELLLQAIEAADDDQLWLDRMIYERINP
jgi:hypothetical protein